jgi:RimJ/RimL family protein N-acetyltransferase
MSAAKLVREERAGLNATGTDQSLMSGKTGAHLAGMEIHRTTKTGLEILLRPVRRGDEPLLEGFFRSLSEESLYRRFLSVQRDVPHERLQRFIVIDHAKEVVILALAKQDQEKEVVGLGEYHTDESAHIAELALVVRDDYQNRGVGTEMLSWLIYLARRQGLAGLTAEVLVENRPMLHLFEKTGLNVEKKLTAGVWELRLLLRERERSQSENLLSKV